MSFIYCRNCNWQQDDFWSKNYNPCNDGHYEGLLMSMLYLPADRRYQTFDIGFIRDRQLPSKPNGTGGYEVEFKEILARRFDGLAERVRNMKWWTHEDFRTDPSPCCPICKSINLVED